MPLQLINIHYVASVGLSQRHLSFSFISFLSPILSLSPSRSIDEHRGTLHLATSALCFEPMLTALRKSVKVHLKSIKEVKLVRAS